jgi:hypothetical protein
VITLSDQIKFKFSKKFWNLLKKNIFYRVYIQMDVMVDEDEADVNVVVVDPDVHVGCDMPMSIYSQYNSSLLSKLLL